MYLGLQEQLYEPWVLVQEAFGWHLFILTAWASLHSSMSEREHTYYVKKINYNKNWHSQSLNTDVYNKERKFFPKKSDVNDVM